MTVATAVETPRDRALTASRLLWLTLGLALMSDIGAHVDAWYHVRWGFAVESFFTWPHALFYAGRLGFGLAAALAFAEGRRAGVPTRRTLFGGYGLVLGGSVLFLLGGMFDFAWHDWFGFEANLEALLSPSHLWLVTADLVSYVGLLQVAAEHRALDSPRYRLRGSDLPVLLAFSLLLRLALWSLAYADPLAVDYASRGITVSRLASGAGAAWPSAATEVAGTTGIVLHAVLLALFLVGPLRQLRLPVGAVAGMMLWNAWLTAAVSGMWLYLPAAVSGAAVGELLWLSLWRGGLGGLNAERGYWMLAAVVPLVQFAVYFGLMAAFGGGIAWTTHLWAGAPIMAGFFGLITGLLAVPPRFCRAPVGAAR